jgi:hypothetical protein
MRVRVKLEWSIRESRADEGQLAEVFPSRCQNGPIRLHKFLVSSSPIYRSCIPRSLRLAFESHIPASVASYLRNLRIMPPSDFANANVDEIVEKLTTDESIQLIAGSGFWHTHSVDRLGIPAIKVCLFMSSEKSAGLS